MAISPRGVGRCAAIAGCHNMVGLLTWSVRAMSVRAMSVRAMSVRAVLICTVGPPGECRQLFIDSDTPVARGLVLGAVVRSDQLHRQAAAPGISWSRHIGIRR